MPTKYFHPDDLSVIRESCDWRRLLADLGVRQDVAKSTTTEFWGYSPFNPDEKTASFHMKEKPGASALWYDWSHEAIAPGRSKAGGGVIELVQCIFQTRGEVMKLNAAANWLIEKGYSRPHAGAHAQTTTNEKRSDEGKKEKAKRNAPIVIDLSSQLQFRHEAFSVRGVSEATCRYLRCGYFTGTRGGLAKRLVFQIGGVEESRDGVLQRVILSHAGRATTPAQEAKAKWWLYKGFNKSSELYNFDNLLLDPEAVVAARESGRVLLVEGAFDVAKCVEAGIKNVVASFGAQLSEAQVERLSFALVRLDINAVTLFYDRDAAGRAGTAAAQERLQACGVVVDTFDWDATFSSPSRGAVPIPPTINDPCDFTAMQLRWILFRRQVNK